MGCATTNRSRNMLISKITTINIHHGTNGETEVWAKFPNEKELIASPELQELPDFIDMILHAKDNPALRDALETAKIVYRLSKDER